MSKHILIFDSGLGGATILKEIESTLSQENYCYSYVMDEKAFPYSNKSNSYLNKRIMDIIGLAIQQTQPDIVIIACNTASTLALDTLRDKHPMPFVGVVPAIKPAALQSQSQVICLLATEATIQREYIDTLQDDFAPHCRIIRFGSSELVTLAEAKMRNNKNIQEGVNYVISALKSQDSSTLIDTFILGCTHFPAIKPELIKAWGKTATWVDSGSAIASRVASLLDDALTPDRQENTPQPNRIFYTTQYRKVVEVPEYLQLFGFNASKKL